MTHTIPTTVSCCIIARGRLDHLRRVLVGLGRQERRADEVIVVAMGDPDVVAVAGQSPVVDLALDLDCDPHATLPLARARNAGAARAGGDLLVFLDVDCIPAPGLIGDYERHLRPGLLMGGVRYLPRGRPRGLEDWSIDDLERWGTPHPARPDVTEVTRTESYELFWSLNFAASRGTWRELGGFDEGYRGYGAEDTDLAFTARSAGVRAWFLPGADAFHQHHATHDPPVQHLPDIVENATRFRQKWGEWPMAGWLRQFAADGLIEWRDDRIALRVGDR